jgi:hypothetical protein
VGIQEDSERFFCDVYALEYSEENQRLNDFKSRDAWEFRLFDAWGQCYLAADTARGHGDAASWVLWGGYEIAHEAASWVSLNLIAHDSLTQDTYNQAVGRSIATRHRTGDLHQLCFDAVVGGRLDLTLAGIPKGTRLRTFRPPLQLPSREASLRLRQRAAEQERRA